MVNIEKKKDKTLRKDNKSDNKRIVKRTEKNPLKIKLASEKEDKRKSRKEFFIEKSSAGKRRDSEKERNDRPSYGNDRKRDSHRERSDRPSYGDDRRRDSHRERIDRPSYNDDKRRNSHSDRSFPSNDSRKRPYSRKEESGRPVRTRKRNATAESEILSEIVDQRRKEGRGSERKPKILSLQWSEERGPIRLNKYIANAGICSRREADKLIEAGAVKVNGEVVTELGTKVMPTDEVRYEDKILQREKPVYILLNKPKDYITTTDDEFDRKNVMMLIEGACPQRVYPVGRLDRNTTGLLLFTNDGELAKNLTHPKYGVRKIYHVELDRNLSLEDFESIAAGIELSDGLITPDEISYVGDSKKEIGICIHSGKNRIVRRIFEKLGYTIEKLDRVSFAGLTKKDVPRGHWRFLKQEEINILKMST
ncbi:MAG: pseudouridine synthase [Bacteroidales bacterium]